MKPLFLFVAAPALWAGTIYQLVDLGVAPGAGGHATGMSSTGLVSGTASNTAGDLFGFTINASGILTLGSAEDAQTAGINSSGVSIGTSYTGGTPHLTYWDSQGAHSLSSTSYGLAINDYGQMAGQSITDGAGHILRVTGGLLQDLGTAGGSGAAAYGINANGDLAGSRMQKGHFSGFIWTAAGFVSIGTFGGLDSWALALNDAGQATGHASTVSGAAHAFLWTNGVLQDLGTLGGGSSYGYSVNDSGDVVGYSFTANGQQHAFLWRNGTLLDLNSLIGASGWVLVDAVAVNNNGQIAGDALVNGVAHLFRLDPVQASRSFAAVGPVAAPEPGVGGLVALGFALFVIAKAATIRPPK